MKPDLLDLVLSREGLADLDPAGRRLALRELVAEAVPEGDHAALVEEISDHIDGAGPLSRLLRDPDVTDVLVNGPDEVWIERRGLLERTDLRFGDRVGLISLIERLISSRGGRIDASHPIADARLADGSRMHAVLPPIAPDGPIVSIRRFPRSPFSLPDLVALGMLPDRTAEMLETAVRSRSTIAIAGGTGAGKTTLLNALLACVPAGERVVTIEETPELVPRCAHAVSLIARPENLEGRGRIGLEGLLRAALRMRPDRIVVGEVRGPEAVVALDAMSTGHAGSLVTVHASSATGAIERMVSLASGAGRVSERSLRVAFRQAFDLVVHIERVDGLRRIAETMEVA